MRGKQMILMLYAIFILVCKLLFHATHPRIVIWKRIVDRRFIDGE